MYQYMYMYVMSIFIASKPQGSTSHPQMSFITSAMINFNLFFNVFITHE